MTKSTQLDKPFDIYEVNISIDGTNLMHLAPIDMGGVNQIAPTEDEKDTIYKNASGEPIGRAAPQRMSNRMARVTISLYANSSYAETMMDLVVKGTPVSAGIIATADAGTTLSNFSVDNVVFLLPSNNFDSDRYPLVFSGVGWNVAVG